MLYEVITLVEGCRGAGAWLVGARIEAALLGIACLAALAVSGVGL